MAKSTGKPLKRIKNNTENEEPKVKRRQAPGRTIEARENQITRLAYDLAEKRIRNGTATSQEVTHFLKIGSTISQLEKAKLDKENELLEAKTEAIKSQKKVEELYANALSAMKSYSGQEDLEDDD